VRARTQAAGERLPAGDPLGPNGSSLWAETAFDHAQAIEAYKFRETLFRVIRTPLLWWEFLIKMCLVTEKKIKSAV